MNSYLQDRDQKKANRFFHLHVSKVLFIHYLYKDNFLKTPARFLKLTNAVKEEIFFGNLCDLWQNKTLVVPTL
jgi:hypothetical protein